MSFPQHAAGPSGRQITTVRRDYRYLAITDLPLELCDQIAWYLPSHTVNNVARASRRLYELFNSALYRVISAVQAEHLFRTLADSPELARKVRHLHLFFSSGGSEDTDDEDGAENLDKLLQVARRGFQNLGCQEASLLSLGWNSDVLLGDVGLVRRSGRFQDLKKLAVWPPRYTSGKVEHDFEFMGIESLESLKYVDSFNPATIRDVPGFTSIIQRLQSSLRDLQVASPKLHAMDLRLGFDEYDNSPVQDTMQPLVSTINSLRFAYLRRLWLHFALGDRDPRWADFRPFLDAHPSLQDVMVDLHSQPLDPASLPALTNFVGRPHDLAAISQPSRPIGSLELWVTSEYSFRETILSTFRIWRETERLLHVPLSGIQETLKKLCLISTLKEFVYDIPYFGDEYMSEESIKGVVRSWPSLTDLEVYIDTDLRTVYAILRGLPHLQRVKLHLFKFVTDFEEGTPSVGAAPTLGADETPTADETPVRRFFVLTSREVFPLDTIASDIYSCLALHLPRLCQVELELQGRSSAAFEDEEWAYSDEDHSPYARFFAQYSFMITRDDGVKVQLVSEGFGRVR